MTRPTNRTAEHLIDTIRKHRAEVGIIGLGYVGLPLALAFCQSDFKVLGFDVDADKIGHLNRGESYIEHIGAEAIRSAVEAERLAATTDLKRLGEPDVILICVPTPLTPQREPDLSYLNETAEQIARVLRRGQLVVLESTTYPGTTDELLRRQLETSGLRCGEDFFLAYSPEREDPGNPEFATASIPKVVGGVDAISGDLAQALYDEIVVRTVRVSNSRTAEATKLMENIFRAVNIALVNELKVVYEQMGIDVWEVLDAAATKPFGFQRFTPGPGWGGHCIPIDPFYLSWKARQHGVTPRFIELAGVVNIEMPRYVMEKLEDALRERGKGIKGSRILLLGIAYKKDIADPRESPAFEILSHLLERGAEVCYHDPLIPEAPAMRTWQDLPHFRSRPLTPELLAEQDAVVVVTDHSSIDYDLVLEHADCIIDTRGVYRAPHAKVVRA